MPGVIEVITAADLTDVSRFPNFAAYVHTPNTFPLAQEKVRYVGAPVAAVLAEDRYIAEDAAELVEVDYDELPAVTDMDAALEADSPLVFDHWPDNRMLNLQADDTEVAAILAENRVIRRRYRIGRHTAMPMETRASMAEVVEGGRLQLWPTNQHAHMARTILSYVLPIPERDIKVTIPYVGGGFGQKQHLYQEDVLVSWLALRHGRPVRYVEDRAEHMIAAAHARDQLITIEAAVADDGRILALRSEILQDLGSAEIFPGAYCPAMTTSAHMTGPYDIKDAAVSVVGVTTNKTPGGSYRGYGVPEAVFAVERFVDEVAEEVGVDRLDLRRSMLLQQADLPYTTTSGALLDSGSFAESFEKVVELGESALERARARHDSDPDSRVGVGYAVFFEGVSPTHHGASAHWTGHESCSIEVQPDGGVRVASGVTDQGQGTTTFVATLTADALGVPLETVHVELADSDSTPYGLGAFGSRQAVIGGGAILLAAGQVRDKIKRIAAHMLEAPEDDMVIEAGHVHVQGSPEPSVTIAQVATRGHHQDHRAPAGHGDRVGGDHPVRARAPGARARRERQDQRLRLLRQRGPRRGHTGRRGDGRDRDPRLLHGPRLRDGHQPPDRRRSDLGRDRAGHRRDPVRGPALQRSGPAPDCVHGLPRSLRDRDARLGDRALREPVAQHASWDEGGRRGRHRGARGGYRQRSGPGFGGVLAPGS